MAAQASFFPNTAVMKLADLLPDADYRFQMRFERGEIASFFGATADREPLLAERRSWLASSPQLYAALLPEGVPLLREAIELAREIHPADLPFVPFIKQGLPAFEEVLLLGQCWEPDFLLLKSDEQGQIRLWAGCVCFSSSWSLAEKIGRPIQVVHDPVPGLNEKMGSAVHSFLMKLKPGIAWQRNNWGLSRSPDLNQHPERHLPRLDATVKAGEVWFRVEHQALVALPETQGILFGIRIAVHSLDELKEDAEARLGLIRALRTMPEELAVYKGLAEARQSVIRLLEA